MHYVAMKHGSLKNCKQNKSECRTGKPIKIVGISSSKRASNECAREDPISLELLKISLKEAQKEGAETQLIDLRDLKIGACKECYSTCPAQCRFNEKENTCDCYTWKAPRVFLNNGKNVSIEEAYDLLGKNEFLEKIQNHYVFSDKDEMHVVYKALREADGVIFSTFTNYYSSLFCNNATISMLLYSLRLTIK